MGQGAQHKQQYQSGLVWLVWKGESPAFLFPSRAWLYTVLLPEYHIINALNTQLCTFRGARVPHMSQKPQELQYCLSKGGCPVGILPCSPCWIHLSLHPPHRPHPPISITQPNHHVLTMFATTTTFTQLCLPWVQMRIIQTYSPHHLLYFAPFWLGRDPVPRQYFNALCVCYLYAKAGWFCT